MLQQLRKASKSWVASVIVGVLVLAFALWGVADVFRGGADTTVAQIGQTTISENDYVTELKNQLKGLSAQTKSDITMEQARAIGLDRQVLDQEINRAALDEIGNRLGIMASQASVSANIRGNNAFIGPSGAFDPNVFGQAIQASGLSEQAFIDATTKDIARSQLLSAASDGIIPPPGLTRLLYDFVNEQRTVEYLVVTPQEAGTVPEPSEADLAAYHKAHAAQFSSPEYRAIDYVEIGPAQVAKGIEVSDADAQKQYDAHKDLYNKPELRDIEQITFPAKDAADAAAMRIKTPADFAAVAHERGIKDADMKLGTVAAGTLAPALGKAVFAVPEGGITAPVQGPFGSVILRAAKVTPGEQKSFDAVKDQIKTDLAKQKAAAGIADTANAFEDARGGGATMEDAAKKMNLPFHHVDALDAKGMTPGGTKADIPAAMQFLAQAFATESGEESELFQAEDGENYAIKVDSIKPPALKPLDSVRMAVRDGFMAEARIKLLQTKVQAFVTQARAENSLAGVAKTLGHMPVTSMPLKRGAADDIFSAGVNNQVFLMTKGGIASGPAGKGDGYVIARIVDIAHPEPDVSAASYTEFKKNMSDQLGGEIIETMAAAARKDVGVQIHQATVDGALGAQQQ